MMKISRLGIFVLLLATLILGTSCGFYNRVMSRKSLVDGAKAYKERNFQEAEEKFRSSVEYDPDLTTLESKTAQLFLARTIHSEFAGDRGKTDKAESAINEYKIALKGFVAEFDDSNAALQANPEDEDAKTANATADKEIGSIVRSVASLYENLQQEDNWKEWQTTQAANEKLPNDTRASSYVALAAKEYNCAKEITDAKEVKKTVKEDGKDVFKFTKPENEEDFERLKKCVEAGTDYINKAVELNTESDSAWSYKASLLEQSRRIADMEGETEKAESLKEEFTSSKKKFEELAEKRRLAEEEEEKRKAREKAIKDGETPPADSSSEDSSADEKASDGDTN